MDWVIWGWPLQQKGTEYQPYVTIQHKLLVLRGCLLWGSRVVVPLKLQETVLKVLHEGNPGILRMKGLARSYVWWP